MIALSIRQPWASLIILGHKDIENRSWPTSVRGRVLIHASRALDPAGFDCAAKRAIELPSDLQTGGIVGSVEIVDCVSTSESPWFFGPFGFVLRSPESLPF